MSSPPIPKPLHLTSWRVRLFCSHFLLLSEKSLLKMNVCDTRQFLFSTSLLLFCALVSRNEKKSFFYKSKDGPCGGPVWVGPSVRRALLFCIHSFLFNSLHAGVFVMIGPVVGEWGGLVERPTLPGCDAQIRTCLWLNSIYNLRLLRLSKWMDGACRIIKGDCTELDYIIIIHNSNESLCLSFESFETKGRSAREKKRRERERTWGK